MELYSSYLLTSFCSWTALGGVLITGVNAGGPAVMIYSWIGISLLSICVAYSLAEMCSALPLAGGQYSWVAVLAPPKVNYLDLEHFDRLLKRY